MYSQLIQTVSLLYVPTHSVTNARRTDWSHDTQRARARLCHALRSCRWLIPERGTSVRLRGLSTENGNLLLGKALT